MVNSALPELREDLLQKVKIRLISFCLSQKDNDDGQVKKKEQEKANNAPTVEDPIAPAQADEPKADEVPNMPVEGQHAIHFHKKFPVELIHQIVMF